MIRESISKNGEIIRVHYRSGELNGDIIHKLEPVFIGVMNTAEGSVDIFNEPPQLIEHALIPSYANRSLGQIPQEAPQCKAEDKFEWKLENV